MVSKESLGKTIQKIRVGTGKSQEELAREVDLSRNQIHRIEIGQSYPKVPTLINIAGALKQTPDYILKCAREDSNLEPDG